MIREESEEKKFLYNRMSLRSPVLVLGAGFSRGVENGGGKELPDGTHLANELFSAVLESHKKQIEPEDMELYREDRDDLKKTCDNIRLEKLVKERDDYLTSRMSGCHCRPDDYHMWLREYPWRHIFTLNIDDLVEFIYADLPKSRQPHVHIRQSSTLNSGAATELYKLHGSVKRPDLEYVFDSTEYRRYAATPSWTLESFGTLFLTNDVVFLGTEFQEEDLLIMLERLMDLVKIDCPYHYFFLTPRLNNRQLRRRIRDESNLHLLEWDSRKFLHFINQNFTVMRDIRRKMRDYGMVFYDEKQQEAQAEGVRYMSELYLGAPPRPIDFFKNLDIVRPELKERAGQLAQRGGRQLVVLYGQAYVGKTCAAIRLGVDLMGKGYEFCRFDMSYSMNASNYQDLVLEYLAALPEGTKVAIMAENMSYYYSHIKQILERCPENVESLIVLCTANRQDHVSKRYLLDQYETLEEIPISEHTSDSRFANEIYDQLEQTNHLNKLRTYGDNRRERVAYIRQLNDLIDVLYVSQEGRRFVRHYADWLDEKPDDVNRRAFLMLCGFAALGVSHLSMKPFLDMTTQCGMSVDMQSFLKAYGDAVQLQDNRLQLRCSRLLWAAIQKWLNADELLEWIRATVCFLARNLREKEENQRNEMFQKLIKVNTLHKQLGIPLDKILDQLLLGLEPLCKHLSYYWVQRGICHRDLTHFEEANSAFSEASEIRNNTSFHIRHAQAKNYMEWGVWALEHEEGRAYYYFDIGRERLETLIEKAPYRYFAYSVHTYVDMMVRYYRKSGERMSEEKLQTLALLLQRLLEQNDRLGPGITKTFLDYCHENGCKIAEAVAELGEKYRARYPNYSFDHAEVVFDSDDIDGDDELENAG